MSCGFLNDSAMRWLLLAPLMALTALACAANRDGAVDDAGVQMRWRYEALAGPEGDGLGRLSFELRDRASGSPLRYAPGQIGVWLQRQRAPLSDGELSCKDRLKALVSSGIGRRADVDLNTYRILTLNADRTLAFINPFVALNNAKLESIVSLPGAPLAWAHLPSRALSWVLLDGTAPRLVAIDTHRRRIVRTLDLPAGTEPQATLAADDEAGRLWVSLPARGRVAVLDLAAREPAWRFADAPAIQGLHRVATAQGTQVFSAHADGRLARWSFEGTPVRGREWLLPHAARGLAYSALGRRLVAHDGQAVLSIDPDGSEVRRLTLGHAVADLAIVDEGRYAIAAGGARMSMVDLASGSVQARSATVPDARQVLLTNRFAYAVAGDQASASLWALSDLRAGRVQPAQILLGTAGALPDEGHRLRRGIVAPGGAGLLVAHGGDQLVYQYSEGMMAPVGSYSNYRRTPLAIGLLDLAPREVAPGRYEVAVRYDTGGAHHLIVSGAAPRFAACDRVALAATPAHTRKELAPALLARLVHDGPLAGARRRIVVAMSEQPGGQGPATPVPRVADLTLLLFDKRSGWQQRAPLREQAGTAGRYETEVNVPTGTGYELFVGSVSRDLPYVRGRVSSSISAGERAP